MSAAKLLPGMESAKDWCDRIWRFPTPVHECIEARDAQWSAEVERLRAALLPFAEIGASLSSSLCHRGYRLDQCQRCQLVIAARAALEPKP